jgi:signal transduction histidine kinase
MNEAQPPQTSSWRRAKHRIAHSIKLRLVLVFLLLATAMTFVFFTGAQKAFSVGWREAARPLLMDYVDRLAGDIAAGGPPSVERALAVTERLPLTVQIDGPQVRWASHPGQHKPEWQREGKGGRDGVSDTQRWNREDWGGGKDWPRILTRTTADGHTIEFGINEDVFERRPRLIGYALAAVLLLTLLAWLYVRRLLRPLDAIGEGARRFGAGDFSQPIPDRCCKAHDELGELALTINTMGRDIHRMLEAKRALLLAISHELRSPLTRARLNTELLPETADVNPQRQALLRDLQEMAGLITDLLESERLAGNHTALQREPVALARLAQEVVAEVLARQPVRADARPEITLHADPSLPPLPLDPARMRLLLRNLLDNALRHSAGAPQPPELHLRAVGQGLQIEVRDHGPGVPDDQLPHLAEPFFRPDTARTRAQGGVGLGLYLCKLVAQAHGGTFAVRNAAPGLAVTVTLPGA